MNRIKRFFLRLCLCLLSLAMLLPCVGCSSKKPKALMTLGDHTLSVNLYELYLSRWKSTLARNGYEVSEADFWKTVISKADQTTYDDYFRAAVLDNCRLYLTCLYLFDEEGLSLSAAEKEQIEATMEELLEYGAEGSKSTFNANVASFGANYDIVKEAYTLEAKYNALLTHFYGTNGSLLSDGVIAEFLAEHYVAFKQIFVSYYYNVYETDKNGDEIYYNPETNHILYDKVNGTPSLESKRDTYGDVIYYLEDGRIAYDTENGKRAEIDEDQDGNVDMAYYTDSEKAALKARAESYYAYAKDHSISLSLFEGMIDSYSDGANAYQYIETGKTYAYAYVNDILTALSSLEVGEVAMVESDYGCFVLMKTEPEEKAWTLEANYNTLSQIGTAASEDLLLARAQKYYDQITVNEEVLSSAYTLAEIGINYYY